MNEIYVDIEGYEGLYQVSNKGNVKSMNYNHTRIEKILKASDVGDGHLVVHLKNNEYVHKLVAKAFIPNPHNYTVVHHIDHNQTNNCVENLMWIDEEEHNRLHGRGSKTVYQYTLEGELVRVWEKLKDIERELGYDHSTISKCCNGKRKQAYGYRWSYVLL